jgi:HK97 family phage major capsid protein
MASVTIEEHRAELADLENQIRSLEEEHQGERLPEEARNRWNELNESRDEKDELVKELEARAERVGALAQRTQNRDRVHVPATTSQAARDNIYDLSTVQRSFDSPSVEGRELRERASRALESFRPQHPDADREGTQGNVQNLLDGDNEDGRFARYVLTTSAPAYSRAFGKILKQQPLTRDEQAAVESVQHAERALSLTAGSGGFAVPFELDPTILNTSSGVVNPIRAISRVERITTDEWRGIASTGITATYEAEATETTDNAPTLTQPTVSTEKAQAFIPFSIEIDQDWGGMRSEMANLLQDSKDTLEAAKFATGTGTNEPFGVLTGTTTTVNAAAGQTFTLANLYSLIASLPPRYRARGVFVGDLQILNRIRQFDTVGSSAAIWVDSLQDDVSSRLLGKPVYEGSEFPDTPATAAKFLVFGDFSRYLIVDRIGLSVEVIPHLMGANRRPTGQRGLYAYWRNGAKVLDANAFRALLGVA